MFFFFIHWITFVFSACELKTSHVNSSEPSSTAETQLRTLLYNNSSVACVADVLNLLYRKWFRRVRGSQATALLVRDIKYRTMHEMLWYDHSNVTLSAILSPGTIFSWSLDLFFTHAILTFSMTAKVLCKRYGLSQAGGEGGTPDFKWQGWSNGGKNQTQKYP